MQSAVDLCLVGCLQSSLSTTERPAWLNFLLVTKLWWNLFRREEAIKRFSWLLSLRTVSCEINLFWLRILSLPLEKVQLFITVMCSCYIFHQKHAIHSVNNGGASHVWKYGYQLLEALLWMSGLSWRSYHHGGSWQSATMWMMNLVTDRARDICWCSLLLQWDGASSVGGLSILKLTNCTAESIKCYGPNHSHQENPALYSRLTKSNEEAFLK